MSRRTMYRTTKGAFFCFYINLFFTASFAAMAIFQASRELTVILTFCILNLVISLWAKRAIIYDYITGQTKVFHGGIACREIADNLKCIHNVFMWSILSKKRRYIPTNLYFFQINFHHSLK